MGPWGGALARRRGDGWARNFEGRIGEAQSEKRDVTSLGIGSEVTGGNAGCRSMRSLILSQIRGS